MLKQSFTTDNFENIFDIENRKSNIKEYLGSEYSDILAKIKLLDNESSQIKRKKKGDRTAEEEIILIENKEKREEFLIEKKEIQRIELEKISRNVNSKFFRFSLTPKDDKIFVIQDSKEAFFAIKQLQYNIQKTFKVKQCSRHLILSQIKLLLNDSSPKYVIRTDISKFFESIPQNKLLKKINDNTLLNVQSKNFIKQILDDYNSKKTEEFEIDKGVPRGVGISPYLTELYLKDVDSQIQKLSDVIYYARYVDDIFIIISPKLPKKRTELYFEEIKEIVEKEGLSLKEDGDNKCCLLDISATNVSEKIITYLGYAIHLKREGTKTTAKFGLSESKKEKIETRITKCFDYFNSNNKYGIRQAKRELLLSLRFLCSNTKLSGAKSRVKTGIFYSNDLLDQEYFDEIHTIDNFLNTKTLTLYSKLFSTAEAKQLVESNIKGYIIRNINFMKGFTEKTFHAFSNNDLRTIKKILR